MRESIRGYADAVLEAAGSRGALERVAGELASFSQLLADNEDLRGALSDPGLHRPTRRAIVQDLLADRADPGTVA
ncbi:MAG TPA: F0F1 ATP synthase subunit delta, partial [Acidimicrobiales bacterium]|nr:F0F1 ATP synthase subunit delta [Acidimicrobiales bacterium]